jgi:hypothetical protein
MQDWGLQIMKLLITQFSPLLVVTYFFTSEAPSQLPVSCLDMRDDIKD